jgi:predicted NodU family carbamoyl transferase
VSWVNADQLRFVLREGKKRQIRRMCELVGLNVTGLKRVRIGSVMLGDLPLGQWRYLRPDEIEWCLQQLGFDLKKVEIVPVEHHLAHASSAYHCSGFKEKTAILGIDGKGEYATTFFGYGENGKIHKIKEFYDPDSLGGLYGALTEFLGFEMLDGEYKVMGMAPYGDPTQIRLLAPGEVRERRTGHQHRLRQRDRLPPLQGKRQGLLLLAQADRLARPEARRRHRRRPLHPLRREHAEAVRGPIAADDRVTTSATSCAKPASWLSPAAARSTSSSTRRSSPARN